MLSKPLPKDYLDEYFSVDLYGNLSRTDRRNSNGSLDKDGYLIIKIKGQQFKSHRIAYYLYNGVDVAGVIDHIDGNRLNNSKPNLRDVTQAVNVKCTPKKVNKETGEIGIYIDRCTKGLKKKFTTKHNKKRYRFLTLQEAINFKLEKQWQN